MKKVLVFISAAALLLASCSKIVENDRVASEQGISFKTAAHVTKVTGSVFPKNETFSVYAWTEASVLPYFMDDVTVAYSQEDDAWKTQGTTYYWPKNATVDFIAYYPTGMDGIEVEEEKITYSDIEVNRMQQDIMYSDKAAGFSNNADLVEDGVNSYEGVPIIFRHALAKVRVLVELVYNHKEEADGTVTDWSLSLNEFQMSHIYSLGSCELILDKTPETGLIGWIRPEDEDGNAVWTPDADHSVIVLGKSVQSLVPGNQYEVLAERYVLPQTLMRQMQRFDLNLTINTMRNNELVLSETFTLSPDIFIDTLPAWEMNHVYTYRIRITPTASSGGDDPDPDDPDLDDVIITFDPAIDGWENVGVETVLTI